MVSVGGAHMVATARYPLDNKLKCTGCNNLHCHKLQDGVIISGLGGDYLCWYEVLAVVSAGHSLAAAKVQLTV